MNRIRELRKSKGLRQVDLAKIMQMPQGTLSTWETGRSEPDFASLRKLADFFEVTVDYIIGGPESAPPPSEHGVWVPVLGDIAAGIPIEAIEDIVDYEEIDLATAASGEHFGLRIKGSSMEPRIREGDVVIVRKQESADTGDTVAVLVNGDNATVKRIKKEPDGGIWLIPNNPAYEARYFSPAEVEALPVRIIGKVIELRGKF